MIFGSSKTYTHAIGLSCAFRQWRAKSHCRLLHGYALQVRLDFEADALDVCNWVMDFGGLKDVKAMLEDTFDHKTLVATDDPEKDWFVEAERRGMLTIRWVSATGCESFARMIFSKVANGLPDHCRLASVEVSEHPANGAIFRL